MNPDQDPNQPQAPAENPAPEAPQTPETSVTPETDETPTPTPNPFGDAPVISDTSSSVPTDPTTTATPISAPADPTVAPASSTPATPAPVAPGGKKKLIVVIALIVGILVILGVAAVIVMGMLFPSKADYRDAATQFNTVSSAYSDLNSDASSLQRDISGTTTDTEYTNDSDSLNKSITTFKEANTKLAGMKAVKVGDGQKLYNDYEAKVNSFVAYATDLSASLKSFRPVAKACDDTSTVTLLTECSNALNNVGAIPNADLKQYVTTLQTQYKAYLAVKTKIDAIGDPYGDQYDTYKTLRDQGYDIQDKISSASSDFSSNARKHAKDIDPATAANALGEFLVKKANG